MPQERRSQEYGCGDCFHHGFFYMRSERRGNMKYWQNKAFSFYSHTECEYFPCHKTCHPEKFNCLFCYCPLYALGDECGGSFTYTKDGFKDCSGCLLPHKKENYGYIVEKYSEIAAQLRLNQKAMKKTD